MTNILSQTANAYLMVQPVSFGYNKQTAVNNYFQQTDNRADYEIQELALNEFRDMVKILRSKDLNIIVVPDTYEPHTPDSIFPNNWVSFHHDNRVALFPMFAPNRRKERRNDIIETLRNKGFSISSIIDYSHFENKGMYLEGTGSMVFDHENRIAYASLSERTNKEVSDKFCASFNYTPIYFVANQTVNNKRVPIYHTNVMMCIGKGFAVICLAAIDDDGQRIKVTNSLINTNKEIIDITEKQMHCFAGNMLQMQNDKNGQLLAMSQTAYNSLTPEQIKKLGLYCELVPISIPSIEKYGGGSVRCMIAEIFNNQLQNTNL